MATKDGRRYSYLAPTQSHPKGRGSKGKPSSDKSKAHISDAKGSKGSAQQQSSMATAPKGTPIAAPGGRNSRANTYGGVK